eukprot:1158500-Pelagomonas_calceolata.AAC.10
MGGKISGGNHDSMGTCLTCVSLTEPWTKAVRPSKCALEGACVAFLSSTASSAQDGKGIVHRWVHPGFERQGLE